MPHPTEWKTRFDELYIGSSRERIKDFIATEIASAERRGIERAIGVIETLKGATIEPVYRTEELRYFNIGIETAKREVSALLSAQE